jgi:hypothetical protein
MMLAMMNAGMFLLRGRQESGSCGGLGCFVFLLVLGGVLYFVLKGRSDRAENLGAAKRAMGSGPIAEHSFACPYAKCTTCGASGDKMKQQWDGLRKVTWTCGYCGNPAGIQELKDEELPPSARQRLGLDAPPQSMMQDQGYDQGSGGAVGGILTGMMIGSMLGGSGHHHHSDSGWDGNSSGGSDGGDWNNSGGDSGGDSGGGDSGGDSGGDFGGGGDW